MIPSLLPGFRELRTPLVTGYIYLLALLLLVGDRIPTKTEAQAPLNLLYDVVEWMGKPAALAATTFVAYLVGSVLEMHAATAGRILRQRWRRQAAPREDYVDRPGGPGRQPSTGPRQAPDLITWAEFSPASTDTLNNYITDRLTAPLFQKVPPTQHFRVTLDLSPKDTEGWVAMAFDRIFDDLPQLRTRLFGASKDLYGDYDRLAAEADLKVNVGLAGIVLSVVAAIEVEQPWWTVLCGPMIFLIYRGFAASRQSNDVIVQAIVTDVIKSPKFESWIEPAAGEFAAWVDRRESGRNR